MNTSLPKTAAFAVLSGSRLLAGKMDWGFVVDALAKAQRELEAGGCRHSWLDAVLDMAKEHARMSPELRLAQKVILGNAPDGEWKERLAATVLPESRGNSFIVVTRTALGISTENFADAAAECQRRGAQPGELAEVTLVVNDDYVAVNAGLGGAWGSISQKPERVATSVTAKIGTMPVEEALALSDVAAVEGWLAKRAGIQERIPFGSRGARRPRFIEDAEPVSAARGLNVIGAFLDRDDAYLANYRAKQSVGMLRSSLGYLHAAGRSLHMVFGDSELERGNFRHPRSFCRYPRYSEKEGDYRDRTVCDCAKHLNALAGFLMTTNEEGGPLAEALTQSPEVCGAVEYLIDSVATKLELKHVAAAEEPDRDEDESVKV